MRRLVASGLLPERAGQPVKLWGHVSLAELRALDDGSVLQQQWIGEMAIRWAARRAAASQTGSDADAWLDGKAAGAVACDATIIPVVTGGIDPAALDDLVNLCLHYAGHGPHCGSPPPPDPAAQPGPAPAQPGQAGPVGGPGAAGNAGGRSARAPLTPQALEILRHAIIGKAVDLVSGPGGLASFLRTRQLGARLAGRPYSRARRSPGDGIPSRVSRTASVPIVIFPVSSARIRRATSE